MVILESKHLVNSMEEEIKKIMNCASIKHVPLDELKKILNEPNEKTQKKMICNLCTDLSC